MTKKQRALLYWIEKRLLFALDGIREIRETSKKKQAKAGRKAK